MSLHQFLLEPITCHAWNRDRTREGQIIFTSESEWTFRTLYKQPWQQITFYLCLFVSNLTLTFKKSVPGKAWLQTMCPLSQFLTHAEHLSCLFVYLLSISRTCLHAFIFCFQKLPSVQITMKFISTRKVATSGWKPTSWRSTMDTLQVFMQAAKVFLYECATVFFSFF